MFDSGAGSCGTPGPAGCHCISHWIPALSLVHSPTPLLSSGTLGKLSMARCTDTLMPHMRVSQLEQGVSTSACHSFLQPHSSALGDCVGDSAARKLQESSVILAQLLCSPHQGPWPARTGNRACAMRSLPQSPTLLRIIDEPSTLLPPNRKSGAWMGVGAGPVSPERRCLVHPG